MKLSTTTVKPLALLLLFIAPVAGLLAQTPATPSTNGSGIANARVTVASAAGGLDGIESAIAQAGADVDWVGWTVPRLEDGSLSCCGVFFEDRDPNDRRTTPTACPLEPNGSVYYVSEPPPWLRPAGDLRVLARLREGRVREVVSFAESCPLDAGGQMVLWLTEVAPRDSLAFLETHAGERGRDKGHGVLAALARHGVPEADDALIRLAAPGRSEDLRKDAIFWLGHSRGRAGLSALLDLLDRDRSPEIRAYIAFALSQSGEPEAADRLVELGRDDTDPEVREKGLFWLAQSKDPRARRVLLRAIEEDPDSGVREHAVFALSQLPDQGTEELIKLVTESRDPGIRRKALFWLGQSDDPRAMDFFQEILMR